ncbi:hypothetical protein ACN469_38295 [Corallococcus terminator]
MRARDDKVGIGSVVLGVVLLAAGVPLLVPRHLLSEDSAAVGHREPTQVARLEAPPVPRKDSPEPVLHVEQVQGPDGLTVEVATPAPATSPLTRFAKDALVSLTPDEEALLREEPVDDLATLVTRTERAFQEASPETRARQERRYLAALNLVAKLSGVPKEDAHARDEDARYQRALAREQAKWSGLSPEERARAQETFKEWFFQGEQKR